MPILRHTYEILLFAIRGLYGKKSSAANQLSAGFLDFVEREIMSMYYEDELTRTAETTVIGAILIDEKILPSISEKLLVNDFYCKDLKEIYQVVLDLSGNGKPIDFLTYIVYNKSQGGGKWSKVWERGAKFHPNDGKRVPRRLFP